MKRCPECKQTKLASDFYKAKEKKDGRSSYCKECNRAYSRLYSKRNRDRAVKFVNRIKARFGCRKCGIKQHYLIHFHHLESDAKEATIAILAQRASGNPSNSKIKQEMRKCVTLCANHHTEFHYLERKQGITIEQYLEVIRLDEELVLKTSRAY